jgi:eukaryotic-like serine/threonine-protein kinase
LEDRLRSDEFDVIAVDEHGRVTERRPGRGRSFAVDLGHGMQLEMVEIPAGRFLMGAPVEEPERRENEGPQHPVTVPSFFLGRFPVTQAQWLAVMGHLPLLPEAFRGDDLPVVDVWCELALEFCIRLSRLTGERYRLPSEAEWEYACRAGSTSPFCCGPTITPALANYDGARPYGQAPAGEARAGLTPVGSLGLANAFGLSDMHGNVWEWCADVWHEDYRDAPADGSAWLTGGDQGYLVQRGGSWRDGAGRCRSAFRVGDIAHNSDHIVGLRVCL